MGRGVRGWVVLAACWVPALENCVMGKKLRKQDLREKIAVLCERNEEWLARRAVGLLTERQLNVLLGMVREQIRKESAERLVPSGDGHLNCPRCGTSIVHRDGTIIGHQCPKAGIEVLVERDSTRSTRVVRGTKEKR